MATAETFEQFSEQFLNGTEQVIDLTDDGAWPTIIVRHGDRVAAIQVQGHPDHLCIDVQSFIGGQRARAGVFGMDDGRRFTGFGDDAPGTSHRWPATALVAVIVGEQAETPAD